MITDDDMKKAIDRIARTEDGHLLYLFCQKTLCGVTSGESALLTNEGRRKYAAELMGLMAKGIEASGGHSNAVVTFAVTGGHAISRAGGHGRIRAALAADTDPESGPGSRAGG